MTSVLKIQAVLVPSLVTRDDGERGSVPRPYYAEVPPIESCNCGNREPLSNRHNGGVSATERKIAVRLDKVRRKRASA